MNSIGLASREFRFDQKSFWRDPQTVFFIVGLPLLYLFIFATIFGSQTNTMPGQPGALKGTAFYVAGIIVIGVISAAFTNLSFTLVQERESGNLKRLRNTPLRTSVFIAGYVATALLIAVLLSALVMLLGWIPYGVPIPGATMPAFVVTVLVAAASFSCLAFAFTVAIRQQRAAQAMIMAVTLTLFFISGNFFPVSKAPAALTTIANLFPVRHFNTAMWTVYNPHTTGMGFQWTDIGVIALWGLAGLLIAVRYFQWKPTGDK
jgi:ABC-2 type transport system permease protein